MQILKQGRLAAKCRSCGCKFSWKRLDCFKRGVPTYWDPFKGGFHRELRVYVRCPECATRVDITGKVPADAVGYNDPLCKCEGDYCHCE